MGEGGARGGLACGVMTIMSIENPIPSSPSDARWGSDYIAEMMRALGIEYLALTPGASYRGLHDSLVNYLGNKDPAMLLTLHEESAVAIAHGYAKVTGKPLGVMLHSNVGLMHASMAIFNAWCDRVPMLIYGATGPMDAHARRPFVDWQHTVADQAALVRHFIKWDNQPGSLPAAAEAIARNRPGSRVPGGSSCKPRCATGLRTLGAGTRASSKTSVSPVCSSRDRSICPTTLWWKWFSRCRKRSLARKTAPYSARDALLEPKACRRRWKMRGSQPASSTISSCIRVNRLLKRINSLLVQF